MITQQNETQDGSHSLKAGIKTKLIETKESKAVIHATNPIKYSSKSVHKLVVVHLHAQNPIPLTKTGAISTY